MHGLLQPDVGSPPLIRDGFPEYRKLASPAAGADFSATVDGRYFERLLTVWCNLDTDSNAANREVVLQFLDDAGNVYRECGAATVVAADSVYDYSFSVWQPQTEFPVNASILVPLDAILMLPTFKWKLKIVNVQAGDALTAIRVVRERFFSDSPLPGRDYATDL